MEVGPVDVYIIGFPGNKFAGRTLPVILELVDSGTIRILDLLFVMKDADGVVTTIAAEDLDEDGAAFLCDVDVTEPGLAQPRGCRGGQRRPPAGELGAADRLREHLGGQGRVGPFVTPTPS